MNNATVGKYTVFLNMMRKACPGATVEQLAELCSLARLFGYYNRADRDAGARPRHQTAVERVAARIRQLGTEIGTTVDLRTGPGRDSVTLTLPTDRHDQVDARQRVPEF
ncbi:MAG TPA: hypothetical protein VL403_09235 [Candidatus Kryptonia bacterium]|nr:hypothetical protein [Candidatus Kryptonia bacterium]